MHNAPPVAFPVGRFVWGRWVFVLALTLSASGLAFWQWHSHATSFMVWSAWVLWCQCAGATAWAAPKQVLSGGRLLWTGEVWLWQGEVVGPSPIDEEQALTVTVGLDNGSSMLLWIQAAPAESPHSFWQPGRMHCAWVSEAAMPSKWHGFRCSVYSRQMEVRQAQLPWV